MKQGVFANKLATWTVKVKESGKLYFETMDSWQTFSKNVLFYNKPLISRQNSKLNQIQNTGRHFVTYPTIN